jgi:hypothetical protein
VPCQLVFEGLERMRADGDVMGNHLNHMIFTLPISHAGELVAFSASMAHWPNVVGVLSGVTRGISAEVCSPSPSRFSLSQDSSYGAQLLSGR